MSEFQRAYKNPGGLAGQVCPTCGSRTLRMLFITGDERDAEGRLAFWCDTCGNGLMPSLSVIPPGGTRVQDDSGVPNYKLVTPEPS